MSKYEIAMQKLFRNIKIICRHLIVIYLMCTSNSTFSQTQLKKLSLEELMNIEVVSVSLSSEKLTGVASAIQVITNEDIRRSTGTRLPEVLRLATNLQVSQVNSHDWAITARGFNGLPQAGGILANKLLVMIDGRVIYNPLFGGVYWDVQNTLLEDIDRIEVISGPGGVLWGVNSVNGVINIITKSAKETQGLYIAETAGSFLQSHDRVRYGFKISPNLFCRVYGQHFNQKNTFLQNGNSSMDAWNFSQGGFRMDYESSSKNKMTLQGDFYGGVENDSIKHTLTNGQNIVGNFTHFFSNKSNFNIMTYYDRTWRITPDSKKPFSYELNTYHIDIQHRFSVGNKQSILLGGRFRYQRDKTLTSFVPLNKNMPLLSAFIQDEITLIPKVLKLTVGSKFLHNVFTKYEVHPSARIGWSLKERNTIWASVSRAVRIPTRFDADITVTDYKFKAEKVIAYEVGYRVRPMNRLSLSFAAYYNHYDDLRSLDSSDYSQFPIILANSQKAESWGFEFSGNFQITNWWRVRGGYTYFDRSIWTTNPATLPVSQEFESIDPNNQFLVQSIIDLPKSIQLDLIRRYVGELEAGTIVPKTPSYYSLDVRIAWSYKSIEISCVGQNLLVNDHCEVGLSKIPRSFYGKLAYRF